MLSLLSPKIFLITLVVSTSYELLALNTPFNVFGCRYQYNLKLPLFKYSFLGLPLTIPLFWGLIKFFLPGYLGFIWFDLMFDPAAIAAGYWKFARRGLWFGVPLTNYVGWSIVWLTIEAVNHFLPW